MSVVLQTFSHRLQTAMIEAGLKSNRSKAGVCMQSLIEITGHSRQICRKYLSGQAIPQHETLLTLATALHVKAGWLLFGESPKTLDAPSVIETSAS